MDAAKALKERLARIERLKKMKPRFDKLDKKKGVSVKQFALKYGYSDSHLCHQMAGRRGATEDYLVRLDADLKKEGV